VTALHAFIAEVYEAKILFHCSEKKESNKGKKKKHRKRKKKPVAQPTGPSIMIPCFVMLYVFHQQSNSLRVKMREATCKSETRVSCNQLAASCKSFCATSARVRTFMKLCGIDECNCQDSFEPAFGQVYFSILMQLSRLCFYSQENGIVRKLTGHISSETACEKDDVAQCFVPQIMFEVAVRHGFNACEDSFYLHLTKLGVQLQEAAEGNTKGRSTAEVSLAKALAEEAKAAAVKHQKSRRKKNKKERGEKGTGKEEDRRNL